MHFLDELRVLNTARKGDRPPAAGAAMLRVKQGCPRGCGGVTQKDALIPATAFKPGETKLNTCS